MTNNNGSKWQMFCKGCSKDVTAYYYVSVRGAECFDCVRKWEPNVKPREERLEEECRSGGTMSSYAERMEERRQMGLINF